MRKICTSWSSRYADVFRTAFTKRGPVQKFTTHQCVTLRLHNVSSSRSGSIGGWIIGKMKANSIAIILVLAFIVFADISTAEKLRKNKKAHHRHHKISKPEPETFVDELNEERNIIDDDDPEYEGKEIKNNNIVEIDPCHLKHCGAGRVCTLNDDEEPVCICIPSCPVERDPRRKVCSNHNETWNSDCEIHQIRCHCQTNAPECRDPSLAHVHIEYYGECREMPECTSDEMSDFPRRMRDWLFNVMRDLADRHELSPYYLKMQREAEVNHTRRWTNAAIWKWCDLDGHPQDRSVSRHELFPIRAPLMVLEHCIAPFLDKCDENNDHRITLVEWSKCLELEEDDIEERCDEVRDRED
ncbi:secreted protein, acidic, cysteine-rich [Lycorma delicatula]|uniref:secreted protein, acidic, cysteine-rich n=1 Tax=Lycorma delicatula TaxID=130591 RepID=UPI003F50F520